MHLLVVLKQGDLYAWFRYEPRGMHDCDIQLVQVQITMRRELAERERERERE